MRADRGLRWQRAGFFRQQELVVLKKLLILTGVVIGIAVLGYVALVIPPSSLTTTVQPKCSGCRLGAPAPDGSVHGERAPEAVGEEKTG